MIRNKADLESFGRALKGIVFERGGLHAQGLNPAVTLTDAQAFESAGSTYQDVFMGGKPYLIGTKVRLQAPNPSGGTKSKLDGLVRLSPKANDIHFSSMVKQNAVRGATLVVPISNEVAESLVLPALNEKERAMLDELTPQERRDIVFSTLMDSWQNKKIEDLLEVVLGKAAVAIDRAKVLRKLSPAEAYAASVLEAHKSGQIDALKRYAQIFPESPLFEQAAENIAEHGQMQAFETLIGDLAVKDWNRAMQTKNNWLLEYPLLHPEPAFREQFERQGMKLSKAGTYKPTLSQLEDTLESMHLDVPERDHNQPRP